MRAALLTVLLALSAAFAGTAWAKASGVASHKVRKGDSLELLAAEYYGNREHKIYIMVENRLAHDKGLKPGQRLRIPVSQVITTAVGDTLESIAAEYLDDARRATYLAQFNNISPQGVVAAGQSLRIPLRVTYKAIRDEQIRDIALSLFADASKASLLKEYNFLETDVLPAGSAVSVPIFKVQTQAAKLPQRDEESAARIAKRNEMTERANRMLPAVRASWRDGDFFGVKRELTKLDIDYLDTELATAVGLLLGSSYVAFDDNDSAVATYLRVLERNPSYEIDPYEHSPKVRSAWAKAQQELAGAGGQ